VALTRIDHIGIDVPDLAAGVETYHRLGFSVLRVGAKAIARNEDDFLELKQGPAAGISAIALRSDSLAVDQKAVAARGSIPYVTLSDSLQPRNPMAAMHPNGAYKLERVYVAVPDLAAAVKEWRRILGLAEPKIERGTVIMADMAIFQLGLAGLTLAQPYSPGPAADALKNRGPGPFQILYRTKTMDAAAKWIADHGVPPPARGVRNTGEHAMLVPPQNACGAFIGFVGPA
jgi:Glyoxalase/Bleomycin resistance protein/Dioxygenase superfamily